MSGLPAITINYLLRLEPPIFMSFNNETYTRLKIIGGNLQYAVALPMQEPNADGRSKASHIGFHRKSAIQQQ